MSQTIKYAPAQNATIGITMAPVKKPYSTFILGEKSLNKQPFARTPQIKIIQQADITIPILCQPLSCVCMMFFFWSIGANKVFWAEGGSQS
jgi:hypothetical protein